MTGPKYKLDIFQVLNHIDRKNDALYPSLTEEEQKAFQPLIVMRWLSGINNQRQIMFLNEFANPYIFSLYTHKQLLFDLLTVCTSGRINRYRWNKVGGKKNSKPQTLAVIREYFNYSTTKAMDALQLLSEEDVLQYASELGKQKDEITKIKQEWKVKQTTDE